MGIIFWIVLACVLAGVEIIIPALITIWFAMAALVLIVLSFVFPMLLSNPFLQWEIFIILSIVLLVLTRPFSKKYLKRGKESFRGDFVGTEIEVAKVICKGHYEGRFKGSTWTLISEDLGIQKGDKVEIVSYEGNRIVVKKKEV